MKVSIIIVNYNVRYFLEVCLHSVYRALDNINGEVIVVDNNSVDDSCDMVRKQFPQTVLIENTANTGFSRANNQGFAVAKGEYILFLNPDTVVPEDFFGKMLDYMDRHPEAGGIGPRLIDGKGQYAPDSKKSFPTLSVAIFKATGINKLFPRSPLFNKYYAPQIGEWETAAVEVLSGCCMMMRREAILAAGGAFDEDFFMYFEDGDLCYRIRKAGFSNIYFPEVTVIHYKGESTRKTTLSYVKIFNEAFAIFAKKHYSSTNARTFLFFINAGVVLRAILSMIKTILKIFRMPLFDTIILLLTLWFIKEFWTEEVKNAPIPLSSVYLTFPVYVLIWTVSMFLNGSYDQPYRATRVIRGMLIGTIFCLAFFGLIPAEIRHSRAIIILSGLFGAVLLVALHELLYRLGVLRIVPYDAVPHGALVVAEQDQYEKTAALLRRVHYAPEIYGRAGIRPEDTNGTLGTLPDLKAIARTAGVNEIIFCVNGLRYQQILAQMQHCGGAFEYKIHLPGSRSFVGSNSSNTSGDLYTIDQRYNIASSPQRRNKRVFDIASSLMLLLFSPILVWWVHRKQGYFSNSWNVLIGSRTWIGYPQTEQQFQDLPQLREAILPPYYLLPGFQPAGEIRRKMYLRYARDYKPVQDLQFLMKNFPFLGRETEKDFVKR